MEKKLKERYSWVDVLKFLGIFYIFIGHFGEAGGKFYPFVFQFHVALFFFASGFFFKNESNKNFFTFIKEKFVKIMVPYFIFTFIHFILYIIQNNLELRTIMGWIPWILKGIRNTVPAGSVWFLPCLFVMQLLYFIINRILKKKSLVLIFCISLYYCALYLLPKNPIVYPSMFWNFDTALVYIVYFAVGDILFKFIKNYEYKNLKLLPKVWFIIVSIILFGFTTLVFFEGKSVFGNFLVNDMKYTFDLFVTLLIIIFNCVVAYCLKNIKIFQEIGQETLYLCCNEQIIRMIVLSMFTLLNINLNLSNPLITICYTVILLIVGHKFFVPISKKIFKTIEKIFV